MNVTDDMAMRAQIEKLSMPNHSEALLVSATTLVDVIGILSQGRGAAQ